MVSPVGVVVLCLLGIASCQNFAPFQVLQYGGCKSGLTLFYVTGNNMKGIQLFNPSAGTLTTNLLNGQTLAPVSPNQILSVVQFLIPWQNYFTVYSAQLLNSTGSVVASFDFSCRDNINPSPSLPGRPWTPTPNSVFGTFQSNCYYNALTAAYHLQLNISLVIANNQITPVIVDLLNSTGALLWTGTAYTFDPLILPIDAPPGFNPSLSYTLNLYSTTPTAPTVRGALLYTYNNAVFCINEYPFGHRTLPPLGIPALALLDCSLGTFTFNVWGRGDVIRLIDLSTNLSETNVLTGTTTAVVPDALGLPVATPRTARFQANVQRDATAWDAVLQLSPSQGNWEVFRLRNITCDPPVGTVAPGSSANPPSPTLTFVQCDNSTKIVQFKVSGHSASKIRLLRLRDNVYETNYRSGLNYLYFWDIPGTRYVTWYLPPATLISEVYVVYVFAAEATYGVNVTVGTIKWSCCDGVISS